MMGMLYFQETDYITEYFIVRGECADGYKWEITADYSWEAEKIAEDELEIMSFENGGKIDIFYYVEGQGEKFIKHMEC